MLVLCPRERKYKTKASTEANIVRIKMHINELEIKTRIALKGVTHQEAAASVGCSASHFASLVNGQVFASPALAKRIAEYLGCEVEVLFCAKSVFEGTGYECQRKEESTC
jgi:predicted DNA-binding protein (UPF0251 family)